MIPFINWLKSRFDRRRREPVAIQTLRQHYRTVSRAESGEYVLTMFSGCHRCENGIRAQILSPSLTAYQPGTAMYNQLDSLFGLKPSETCELYTWDDVLRDLENS